MEFLILLGLGAFALMSKPRASTGVSSSALTAGTNAPQQLRLTKTFQASKSRTRLSGTAIPTGPTPTPPSYPEETETYDPAYSESVEINSSEDPDQGYAITGNIGAMIRSDD